NRLPHCHAIWPNPPNRIQIFSLPYRRFLTCWQIDLTRASAKPNTATHPTPADCKSAIQQIENLRYELASLRAQLLICPLSPLPFPDARTGAMAARLYGLL